MAQIPESREALKLGPVQLSGALDAYYSWNVNRPADGINGLHNFDAYSFSPRLNMAEFGLSLDPSPFGFELDAGYGDIYKIVDSGEPDSPLHNVLQAFVSYKAKSLHSLQIDAGKFQTSAGVESAETISGWNYSRSLLFVYAQPNYHVGLRSNLEVNKHIELGLQLVNGWNRFLDGNGLKTVAVTSAIKYDRWTLYQDYYYGPERVGAQFYPRGLYDATLIITLFHNLKADINFDTRFQREPAQTDTWHGVAGSLEWVPYRHLAFSPRYEWFHDAEGYTTGRPQRVREVTLTGDYIIAKGFLSRLEYRRDMSDEAVFQRSAGQAPTNRQTTFLVSLIVSAMTRMRRELMKEQLGLSITKLLSRHTPAAATMPYNLESPNTLLEPITPSNIDRWFVRETMQVKPPAVRHILQHVAKHLSDFVEWPRCAVLMWEGCDRCPPDGKKQKYHRYPKALSELARAQQIKLDSRANGPSRAAFVFAGGIRPERYGSTNAVTMHHVYSGKFPYIGHSKTTHAVKLARHFTQSAGVIAAHPVADALCDEYPFFAWLLRFEAFRRFGYDPDGVFSRRQNGYGFATGFKCKVMFCEIVS